MKTWVSRIYKKALNFEKNKENEDREIVETNGEVCETPMSQISLCNRKRGKKCYLLFIYFLCFFYFERKKEKEGKPEKKEFFFIVMALLFVLYLSLSDPFESNTL